MKQKTHNGKVRCWTRNLKREGRKTQKANRNRNRNREHWRENGERYRQRNESQENILWAKASSKYIQIETETTNRHWEARRYNKLEQKTILAWIRVGHSKLAGKLARTRKRYHKMNGNRKTGGRINSHNKDMERLTKTQIYHQMGWWSQYESGKHELTHATQMKLKRDVKR